MTITKYLRLDVDQAITWTVDWYKILRDDALCEKFSKNAFQHYLDNFTAKIQGDKYIHVYKSLL